FSSASPTPDGAGGGIIQWYDITGGGSLTTGNSVALTVGFVAAGPCSPTTNIATVSGAGAAGGAPQAPSGQDDADVSVVGEPPEIEISKTITAPADGVALVGDTITFTVLITNTGPNAITSLVLTDTYDSNYLTLTSWDPVTPTQQSPGQAVWNTIIPNQPPLLPGETMTVTLDFSAEAEVNLTTNVMAAAATDQFDQIAPVVNDDADVQLALEAAIGGGVYHDLNGNGVFDSGEPPLDNVLITLSNGLTTVTDASGLYTFTVKPGSYTITETNPAGYISTGAMQGTVGSIVADDDTIQVTLGSGQTSLQNNFLDARPNTAIGDYVWYDANQDGIQDVTEPGIANVTLRLYRDDGDGNFEPGTDDALVAATTTDADGGYLFAHLSPGPYFVDVDESSPALTDLTPVSGPQSEVNYTGLIMVASGETYRNADFGFVQEPEPGNVIIGDRVWIDANSNGKQDPGELGLPGVTVVILDEGDNIIGIDVTDSNGVYRIEVPAGTGYKATPFDPGGYTPTTTKPLPLPDLNAGDQYLDADFGYTKPGLKTIAGLVFEDTANNGVYDSGSDNVIAGITVDLIADSNGNGILDAGEPTIATASTGSTADGNGNNYAFVGLPAAKYLVRVSDTQNVLNSFEAGNLGTAGADDNSQAQPYAVDLTSASTNLTADFGYTRAGSIGSGFPTGIIGNQIWYDPDGDGLFEPANGEAGIAGVTIELYLGGSLVATTTTGSSGNYIFTELAAGTYTVTVSDDFDVLAGYLKTSGTDGADDNSQDDPYTVTLASDTDFDFTADFGYALPVTIGDFIYLDSNGNGVQDPSETTGIGSGVPVTLTDAVNNVISTTIAGPTGYYTFTNILPGTFKVIVPSTISGVTLTSVNPINVTLISGQTYLDADFGYIAPTAVGIVSFTAMAEAAGVRLYWQTGLEQDLEGFVVLRSTAIDGAYKAISDLIPAMNDPSGASYEWLDTSVDFESLYWYRLQAQPDGEVFGPIPSREDPGSGGSNRVFVPFVMR
ncbi:MAG: DUF11 domain-containing protein, partial [Caldilineales bacterium]|nr:DUF11 domain-containing protein [Caldilineales bacterium]